MSAPMPKTLSAAETTAKIIAFPTRPWWATADNPACLDWCEVDHDRFLVLARSTVRAAQSDGTFGARSSEPFVSLRLHEPTTADMLDLMSAHARASAVCESSGAQRDG